MINIVSGVEVVLKDAKNGSAKVLLAKWDNPYHRLHLLSTGSAVFKGASSANRDNLIIIESVREKEVHLGYRLYVTGDSKSQTENVLLTVNASGELCTIVESSKRVHSVNKMSIFDIKIAEDEVSLCQNCLFSPTPPFRLRKKEFRNFVIHGFVKLPNIIESNQIAISSRHLLHHAGQVGCLIPGAVQGGQYGKFPGRLSQSQVIKDLFTPELQHLVELILGGAVDQPNNLNTQIAFRFPEINTLGGENDIGSTSHSKNIIEWHTDGYRQGISHSFSLLVGVCLSDVVKEYEGNLCVWPGSHFLLHRCKVGPHGDFDVRLIEDIIVHDEKFSDFRGEKDHCIPTHLAETLTQTAEVLGSRPTLPSLGSPEQIKLNAGDAVILHPDLAHGGAPNYSSGIRQMVYYRVRLQCLVWDETAEEHRRDMWADLGGVRQALGKELEDLNKVYYPL